MISGRRAVPWVVLLTGPIGGCSTWHTHVRGAVGPSDLEGGSLSVVVAEGTREAFEQSDWLPWVLEDAGLAPERMSLEAPDHKTQVTRELSAREARRVATALDRRAPDGWTFEGAWAGLDRAETDCDYRLQLEEADLVTSPWVVPLFPVALASTLTATIAPGWVPTYRSRPAAAPRWEVLRCSDDASIGEGTFKQRLAMLVWFGHHYQRRYVFVEDPFERMVADSMDPVVPPGEAPRDRVDPVATVLAWAWEREKAKADFGDEAAVQRRLREIDEAVRPSEAAYDAVRAGWLPGTVAARSTSLAVGASLGAAGPFACPYLEGQELSGWAKRLAAGEAIGAVAGQLAAQASGALIDEAASHIPYIGGLVAGQARKVVANQTEAAVLQAFKASLEATDWFDLPCDLADHMIEEHGDAADFAEARIALSQVYPELDADWDACPSAAPAIAAPPMDVVHQLERLQQLRDTGVLDEDEFRAAKQKVLSP